MKGVSYEGVGKIVVRDDLPMPSVKPDEALIKVKYCGICGSDVESFKKAGMYGSGTIIGHEISGEIIEIGDNVKKLKIGDHVTINPNAPCYNCYWCNQNQENKCKFAPRALGSLTDGAMAEFINVNEERIHILPESISLEEGAMIEPLVVGIYSVQESGIKIGDSVAVFGTGTIGLMTILALKVAGAGNIYALEPVESKHRIALEMGANKAFTPQNWKKIQRLCDKIGPAHIFDCVGISETITSAIDLVRRGGYITMIGMDSEITDLKNFYGIAIKNITLRGIFAYNQDTFKTAINLLDQKRVNLKPLITKIIKLDEVPIAVEDLSKGLHDDIKIMVEIE
ncbi:MAG TPA: alcohol dehydrogenase catalytic domain-containing protein [Candidatus Nanopelagicaceae bacterium]|nr:alcohol dehydrogenase catalytic domain-containing protein [Candidatus Nanopelagicaceae bacterium]